MSLHKCPCGHHGGHTATYSSHGELKVHLDLVQQFTDIGEATLVFVTPLLLETTTLKQLGLLINTRHRLLLCSSCPSAVAPLHVKAHLSRAHSIKLTESDQGAVLKLSALCGVEASTLPTFDGVIAKIDGLPVYATHPCPLCMTSMAKYNSLKAHMRQKHSSSSYPKETDIVLAQQLKGSGHGEFVRIAADEPPVPFSMDDILRQASNLVSDVGQPVAEPSDDPRFFCPWLRYTRWQDLTLGKDIGELISLVAHPKKTEFPLLVEGVWSLFQSSSALMDSTSELILQRLNTPKPVDE